MPWCLPVRIVAMNISSVQSPRPVSLSGVRFAVKLTPHGPANAVLVAAPTTSTAPRGSAGGGGIFMLSGWPVSARVMSGSGPFGPSFQGVWQSLQPIVAHQIRAALDAAAVRAGGGLLVAAGAFTPSR